MTLARLLETGSGSLAARLVIEGLPVEFVSDPAMERIVPDGRERVYCFDLFGEASLGLVIDESVNIPEAKLEAPGATIRFWETEDERISAVFARRPDLERYVASTIDVGDTSLTLLSADGVSPGDVLHYGTEALHVNAVVGNEVVVTRGYWQSIPQKHWSNEPGINIPYRSIHNAPVRIRGRRVYLYLYGDGDDLQANGGNGGEPVWIGHVSSEPALDEAGAVWRLQVASVAERLKGTVGGELETAFYPRGAYYTAGAPLRVSLGENNPALLGPSSAYPNAKTNFTGFYESQEEFCEALTAWLAVLAGDLGLASTYRAIPTSDGKWTIEVTAGPGVTEVFVLVQSSQDGSTHPAGVTVNAAGEPFPALTTGDVCYPWWYPSAPDQRMIPRGHYDEWSSAPPLVKEPTASGTAPNRRIYVDRAVAADWTAVLIDWPTGSYEHQVLRHDAVGNWIEIDRSETRPGRGAIVPDQRYGAWSLPAIRPVRWLGTGTLVDLRSALVSDGPEYANRSGAPFLTTEDLASWAAATDAARSMPWLLSRSYVAGTALDLEDLLSHEMRLYGVFPVIGSDGKVGVQSLARVMSGGTPVNIDDEIVSAGWSSMERGGQTINRVIVRTGYDPREDEWTGREIVVQNMASYALDHEDRTLEIEPRSRARAGDETIDPEDVAAVVTAYTDIFGFPHDFVTVNVSWQHFPVRLGDPVIFSADHLPSYSTGRRPLTEVRGIVVGRRWALAEVHGTLRLLIHGLNVGGYAPTARVLSQSGSGTTWTLTVSPTLYAPAEGPPASFFAEGYAIRLIQYDSESPTVATGTVTAVSGDDIAVELKESWSPGSATWELCFAPWDDCPEEQRQRFAYIADSSGTINGAGPYLYAPG